VVWKHTYPKGNREIQAEGVTEIHSDDQLKVAGLREAEKKQKHSGAHTAGWAELRHAYFSCICLIGYLS